MNSVAKDIHIIIGTKAQLIKMAPVMKGLESRGVPYNYVSLGQHAETVSKLLGQFQIQGPRLMVQDSGTKDVSSIFGIVKWIAGHLMTIVFRPRYLREAIFKGQDGIALIHGDTLSTLIGLLMAKRAGLKVAHVESGLRSWNYFHPFPEEIIRVICMKFSDYLFAPSDEAVGNLSNMKVGGKVFNTHGNTGMDAVKMTFQGSDVGAYGHTPSKPYVLVSIHRFENLYSRKRFQFILNTVDDVSKKNNVVFVMHGPTEKKLKSKGRWGEGEKGRTDSQICYISLQGYPAFLNLIKDAEFIITDGGSVQEECSYFGKPCLIMRKRTERVDGVGRNAMLGSFDKTVIDAFIRDYDKYKKPALIPEKSPSAMLVDEIMKL